MLRVNYGRNKSYVPVEGDELVVTSFLSTYYARTIQYYAHYEEKKDLHKETTSWYYGRNKRVSSRSNMEKKQTMKMMRQYVRRKEYYVHSTVETQTQYSFYALAMKKVNAEANCKIVCAYYEIVRT